jgi:hypothetical protein
MKTLTCAAVALAVIAGAAPAMAQFYQPAAPDTPIAAPAQSPATTVDPSGRWMLLQGYGKDGEVNFTWYPVMQPDLSRYHGS